MNDLKHPFSLISPDKLYYNVIKEQEDILTLTEKIIDCVDLRKQKEQTPNTNISGIAIYSGIKSLCENGGRILLFNSNPSISTLKV